MAAAEKKPSEKASAKPAVGTLIPQPHGGALMHGNPSLNLIPTPGPGRPPSEVRKAARLAFEERIPTLARLADSAESDSDKIKAIDILGKYGLGTLREMSTDEVQDKLRQTIAILDANLSPEVAERIYELMRPVWKR